MKLKKFTINSGGKFSTDTTGSVVIDLSSKMVGITGDQELGKTTILELFLMACGQLGGKEAVEALKNKDTGKIDLDFSFVGNDRADYDVKVTKSGMTVKREGEPTKGGPKELLKSLLGVVGVSPMEIKNAPIEEIVKWLASYSTRSAEEFEKDMRKIKDKIKEAKRARAEANKSAKGIRLYLADEGYMDDAGNLIESKWKEAEKMKAVDIAALSKQLDDAGKKSDKYIKGEERLKTLREDETRQTTEVEELRKKLAVAEAALADTQKAIATGEKYLTDNKADKVEYDRVKKLYDSAQGDAIKYNKWLEIKRKKKELDEFEDLAQKFDATEKDQIKKQQELQWEVIPDIRGAELVLEDTHEDEGEQKKAGFYYNGMNSRQLSKSEWFGVVLQILKKNKVKILVIDEISDLGSKFMSILEGLVKDGCYVLYTQMSRGQEEIEIIAK